MLTTAHILLTIVTLGLSVVPMAADLNKTHATNPLWIGHARFHVVWQVASYGGLGVLGVCLLWLPADADLVNAKLAAVLVTCTLGGFWSAVISRPLYGGSLADPNGIPPVRIAGREADLNVVVFSTLSIVLAIAWVLLAIARPRPTNEPPTIGASHEDRKRRGQRPGARHARRGRRPAGRRCDVDR